MLIVILKRDSEMVQWARKLMAKSDKERTPTIVLEMTMNYFFYLYALKSQSNFYMFTMSNKKKGAIQFTLLHSLPRRVPHLYMFIRWWLLVILSIFLQLSQLLLGL